MQRPSDQTQLTQDIGQSLNHTNQALLPSELLLHDLKPLLTQLEVGPPQLIHLMSNLYALVLPTHPCLHDPSHKLRLITRRSIRQVVTSLLATMTDHAGVPTPGLVASKA